MIANMNNVSVTSPMGFQSNATSGLFATQGGGDFMAMFMQMLGMPEGETANTEVETFLNQMADGEMSQISNSDDLMKELQNLFSEDEDLDINKLQAAAMSLMPMILPNIQVDQNVDIKVSQTLNTAIQATNSKSETSESAEILQTFLAPNAKAKETVEDSAMNMVKEVSSQSKSVVPQSFEQVVHEVKQSLQTSNTKEPIEIDIDELQKQVKSSRNEVLQTGVNFRDVRIEKDDVKVDPKMLLAQVTNGIKTKMASNESDFTMKLQPEGLGEITVKLVNEAGKLTVNIIASSPKTEQLLNSQLSNLRNSLEQTHSDIKEVNVYKQADSMGFTNGKDFLNQQQQQNRHQHAYQHRQAEDIDSLDVNTMKDYQALMIAGLNRYV